MNYRLAKRMGIKKPVDGYTIEEEVLEKLITKNTIQSLYAKLPTARMKAIVALHFELGYPQEVVAEMFGLKQPSLVDEIALIQRILMGKVYKPRPRKVEVDPKVVEYCAYLLSLDSNHATEQHL